MASNNLYGAVFSEIVLRLTFSLTTGQLLDGWAFDDHPIAQGHGQKDFPKVTLLSMDPTEELAGSIGFGKISVILLVATERKNADCWKEHGEGIARVLNALQLDRSTPRMKDPGLAGTLRRPFKLAGANNSALDVSVQTKLTLQLETKPFDLGNR